MAITTRRVIVANPAKGGKMTAKQIKFFGTKRQRAALKRRRKPAAKSSRPRATARKNSARRAAPKRHAARKRRNPVGESILLSLGNPARGKKMATTKRRRKNGAASAKRKNAGTRRRRMTMNPAKRHHTRRRRNPAGFALNEIALTSVGVIAGAAGSKMLTQAVLGASNTGVMGYGGNALATGLLAVLAHMFKNRSLAFGVVIGGATQILLRVISDYSLVGSYSSQLGIGDYQVANWVQPQTVANALQNAQPRIPAGWAPTTVVSAPAGMGDVNLY